MNTKIVVAKAKKIPNHSIKTSSVSMSPMMPKRYSARERLEIRKKEFQILSGK